MQTVWWELGLLALSQRYFILDVGSKHEDYHPPHTKYKILITQGENLVMAPAFPVLDSCHHCNALIDSRERIS